MPDVLDGSLQKQIGAMWKALSDERFTPPTVTSRFEQVVNVEPGGTPRIIRDVFTIGIDKDRVPVARAMAIGFENGHNILIDLDTMRIRLWTMGEFARQRTEGKSWYWDMPGVVVRRFSKAAFEQTWTLNGNPVEAVVDEDRSYELLSYRTVDNRVEVTCRQWFGDVSASPPRPDLNPHNSVTAWNNPNHPLQAVITKHTFETTRMALPNEPHAGWKHKVEVLECPPDMQLDIELTRPWEAGDIAISRAKSGTTTPKQ